MYPYVHFDFSGPQIPKCWLSATSRSRRTDPLKEEKALVRMEQSSTGNTSSECLRFRFLGLASGPLSHNCRNLHFNQLLCCFLCMFQHSSKVLDHVVQFFNFVLQGQGSVHPRADTHLCVFICYFSKDMCFWFLISYLGYMRGTHYSVRYIANIFRALLFSRY